MHGGVVCMGPSAQCSGEGKSSEAGEEEKPTEDIREE